MELSEQEKQIIVNLLSQVSVQVKEAPIVIAIINKLQQPEAKLAEVDVEKSVEAEVVED